MKLTPLKIANRNLNFENWAVFGLYIEKNVFNFFFLSYYPVICHPGGLTVSHSALSILALFSQHPVLRR